MAVSIQQFDYGSRGDRRTAPAHYSDMLESRECSNLSSMPPEKRDIVSIDGCSAKADRDDKVSDYRGRSDAVTICCASMLELHFRVSVFSASQAFCQTKPIAVFQSA